MRATGGPLQTLARLVFVLILFAGAACVTEIPVNDYNLARAAYDAAVDAGAQRLAPGVWYKADEAYKRGQKLYAERDFTGARSAFEESRFLCEKAENTARMTSPDGGGLQ